MELRGGGIQGQGLTVKRLREVLDYDQATGVFTWRTAGKKRRVGYEAGCVSKRSGYVVIGIDGRSFYAHRLAWLYVTGERPSQIDHRDGKRACNAIANLRQATSTQNNVSRKASGCSFDARRGKWLASASFNGRTRNLGRYESEAEASEATRVALVAVHGQEWVERRG